MKIGFLACSVQILALAVVAAEHGAGPREDDKPSAVAEPLKIYRTVLKLLEIDASKAEPDVEIKIVPPEGGRMETFLITARKGVTLPEVEVEKATGKIVWISNKEVRQRMAARVEAAKRKNEPLKPTRKKTDIVALAKSYCQCFGQPLSSNLKLRYVEFKDEKGEWVVDWNQSQGGFFFKECWVSVWIDDQTGKLSNYKDTTTTKACPIDVKVSEEKAIDLARRCVATILPKLVKDTSYDIKLVGKPELTVVSLTAEPQLSPDKAANPPQTIVTGPRLAYVVRFDFQYTGRAETYVALAPIEVAVDAIAGEVLQYDK